ncbi:hypothetical protein GQ44DRAFT_770334 [Phaeosphaeriaceae sp. PMI808]|nr:hypothetical protein GQ44DRAFT_770334 [Phaeosphaeriaceae sp. PMI808]
MLPPSGTPQPAQHVVTIERRNIQYGKLTDALINEGLIPPKKDVVVATRQKGQQGQPEEADTDTRSAANAFSEGADLAYLNPNIGVLFLGKCRRGWHIAARNRQFNPLTTNPPIPLTDHNHRIIEDTLSDAPEQAEKWISVVVGPILHLLRRVVSFKKSAVPNARAAVLDVTPMKISPSELIPFSRDSTLYRDLDKRIDHFVGLDPHRTTLRTHVARDPAVQLAAWIATEFRLHNTEVEGKRGKRWSSVSK